MTFGSASDHVEPAADYDRFVDWDKRLAREEPFFAREFAAAGVRRIVDVGCGTGKHAVMWARAGLDVVGVDPDPSMLAQAERNVAEAAAAIAEAGGSVTLLAGGFGGLAASGVGTADAVTCTGNALPHVDGAAGLEAAVADFADVLRPGGLLVLHLLNHDRLLAARVRSIPPVVREDETGTWVFLRVMDYVEGGIGFDFVTLQRPAGAWESGAAWETASRRSVHTAVPTAMLNAALGAAGFTGVRLLGGHDGHALDPQADESVIVVARKA